MTSGGAGGVWSGWGAQDVAGKTNAVTRDYVHDSNTLKTDTNFDGTGTAHDAGTIITGLDNNLTYDIAVHINRVTSNDKLDGASVTIGSTTIFLPSHPATNDGSGLAMWPNGGFLSGITSAVFTNVATDGNGNIHLFYDKVDGNPIIFTGLEIRAIPEPASLALLGLGGLLMLGRRRA